jgi:hypothetical protein
MRNLIRGVAGVVMLGLVSVCLAEQIKIGFAGSVNGISDPYNLLQGAVRQGAPISGFYIYDSATPDSEPGNTALGVYEYLTSPYGMSLSVGSLTFQTDSTNVDFIVGLRDNYNSTADFFSIGSYNNIGLDTGVSIDSIHWQLTDNTGNALSSDILPLVPPDLSLWQYGNYFSVMGGKYPFPSESEKTLFNFGGQIDSVWLVPEPASFGILILGAVLMRLRNPTITGS